MYAVFVLFQKPPYSMKSSTMLVCAMLLVTLVANSNAVHEDCMKPRVSLSPRNMCFGEVCFRFASNKIRFTTKLISKQICLFRLLILKSKLFCSNISKTKDAITETLPFNHLKTPFTKVTRSYRATLLSPNSTRTPIFSKFLLR